MIGASNEPTKRGYRAVQTLLRDGFAGQIYPIHPRASAVQGLRAYPDLASVPGPRGSGSRLHGRGYRAGHHRAVRPQGR